MRLLRTALLASTIAATGGAALAQQGDAPEQDVASALSFLQKLSTHYSLLVLRTFVDVTYDRVAVQPNGTDLTISGVTLYPELPWDPEANCEVTIDRITTDDEISFQTVATALELTGVSVPAACFEREVAGMMSSFGYDGLVADTMSVGISYNLPSSSAQVNIQAAIVDAADVTVDADLNYIWFRFPTQGYSDEPQPIIQLGSAEIVVENNGLWEKLEPMLSAQMGDLNAVPQMIEMQMSQMLPMIGGNPLTPEDEAFIANVSEEVGRFLRDKDRIVISAAPEGGVWMDEDVFDSPQTMIKALQPKVSAVSMARAAIIPPADLAAAMADGAQLDDAQRLAVGEALLTGVGAPRNVEAGMGLLMPLAQNWNGEAAALLAHAAAADGEAETAYRMALIAMGGGDTSVLGVADDMEMSLDMATVLGLQDELFESWPGENDLGAKAEEAVKAGDVGEIRRIAAMLTTGRGAVRSYQNAMVAATLAAAAGDRSAAKMRDRLNTAFGGSEAWTALVADAEATALQIWTREGFGEAVAPK